MLHAIRQDLRIWLLPKVRKVLKRVFGLDACKFCLGLRGNDPGNENIYGGYLACDDCSALLRRAASYEREGV